MIFEQPSCLIYSVQIDLQVYLKINNCVAKKAQVETAIKKKKIPVSLLITTLK